MRRIRPCADWERTSYQICPVNFAGEMLVCAREQKQHEHVEHSTAFQNTELAQGALQGTCS